MKGLVFGNSHVGAIREGWRKSPRIDVDFFAIPGGAGPHVKVVDQLVFPARADARLQTNVEAARTGGLDLSSYDYILFASLGLGAVRERFPSHVFRQFSLAELKGADIDETQPLSRAFLEVVVGDVFLKTGGVAALRRVCTLFDGPVLCAPTPIPIVPMMKDTDPLRRVYGPATAEFISWFAGFQMTLIRDLEKQIGPALTVLDVPDPAWLAAGSTSGDYISGLQDPWHMNALYGSRVIDQVCNALELG